MIPRITISFVIFIAIAYIVGARYPGLATKVGLA
jgi:hypothetical protein